MRNCEPRGRTGLDLAVRATGEYLPGHLWARARLRYSMWRPSTWASKSTKKVLCRQSTYHHPPCSS